MKKQKRSKTPKRRPKNLDIGLRFECEDGLVYAVWFDRDHTSYTARDARRFGEWLIKSADYIKSKG